MIFFLLQFPFENEVLSCYNTAALMTQALQQFLHKSNFDRNIVGVISIGSSGGTLLLSSPFTSLPLGIPKMIVSTITSDQTKPYGGTFDLVLLWRLLILPVLIVLE